MDQQQNRHRRRLAGLALPLVLLVAQTTADSTEAPDLPHADPPATAGHRIPSPDDLPPLAPVRTGLPPSWWLALSDIDPANFLQLGAVQATGAEMLAGPDMADASAALADRILIDASAEDPQLAGSFTAAVAEPPGLAGLALGLAMLGAARQRYRGRNPSRRPPVPAQDRGKSSD